MVPFSDVALDHLFQLPHLRTLRIEGPPACSLRFILAPRLPTSRESYTRGRCCTRMAFPASMFRGQNSHRARRGTTFQGEEIVEVAGHRRPLRVHCRYFLHLPNSSVSELGLSGCRGLLPQRRRGEAQCTFRLNNRNVAEFAMALPRLKTLPWTTVSQEYMRHDC